MEAILTSPGQDGAQRQSRPVTRESRVEPSGFERPVEIGSELALVTLIVLAIAPRSPQQPSTTTPTSCQQPSPTTPRSSETPSTATPRSPPKLPTGTPRFPEQPSRTCSRGCTRPGRQAKAIPRELRRVRAVVNLLRR